MSLPASLAALVKARSGERCEYCRMSQSLQGATFHFEHIIPRTCGGETSPENLALACPGCNLHKSDRSHGTDPETDRTEPLYHPRQHRWSDHFAWRETFIVGLTPTGRATISALDLDHARRQRIRSAEALFNLFPPPG
ncbi:HNH endonuclease [Prosthecobacter sp.]|uniref:HNH endonuclease n=1 Tax=Prosthecobacter sp. TaxID=1965333 RepID=UPI0037851DA5